MRLKPNSGEFSNRQAVTLSKECEDSGQDRLAEVAQNDGLNM